MTKSEEVWAEALADPGFKAALDEGLADVAAGRTKPWSEVRARLVPCRSRVEEALSRVGRGAKEAVAE